MTVGRSTSPTHQTGQHAEERAMLFLQQQGFHVVQQNFHGQMGEIDLIVSRDRLLVFVEVRQRKSSVFGGAAASVTLAKQRKISKTAAFFLQLHPEFELFDCRFDVIAMDISARFSPQRHQQIADMNWIEGAFDAILPY